MQQCDVTYSFTTAIASKEEDNDKDLLKNRKLTPTYCTPNIMGRLSWKRPRNGGITRRHRSLGIFVVVAVVLVVGLRREVAEAPQLLLGRQSQEDLSIVEVKGKQPASHKQYYDESKILQFTEDLVQAKQTIVTAFFRIPSKHSDASYAAWMPNMLSLQDPMVIFLSPSMIPEVRAWRQHALNRTVIIPMEIADVPMAQNHNTTFWEWQLEIDKEKKIHRSYYVFWIWLSKSWWVNQAIEHNFFGSEIFVWSDMGCFRDPRYNGKELVLHPTQIPRHSMLFMAHHPTIAPPNKIFNNKYDKEMKKHFFTSGSMLAGYKDTFQTFHAHFLETLQEFIDRDMFVGEDQLVLQSTCMVHPDLCAYVAASQVKDNHYFGLRYILHHGGNYDLWYPPGASVNSAN